MDPLLELTKECESLLANGLKKAYPELEAGEPRFTEPPDPQMGEVATPICFQLAKQLRQPPQEIARRLVEEMKPRGLVAGVEAVQGYLNFHADTAAYTRLVLETVVEEDEGYGFPQVQEPRRVMVEHTSANPNSPLHIGNARNSILGDCLANLYEKRGHKVLIHFLVNDMGRQVAMAVYGWKLLGKPKPEGQAELWVGTIYASVNVAMELKRLRAELEEAQAKGRLYEAADLESKIEEYLEAIETLNARYPGIYQAVEEKISKTQDPMAEIVHLNTLYEQAHPETVKEFRVLINYCLDGFQESLGRLGIFFDSFDFESDLVWGKTADRVLERLRASGYVYKEEGAELLDCEAVARDLGLKKRWGLHPRHEIPSLVLVRSDGTTLYTLRDIAYSIYKFSKADTVINVIGMEQTLAQLQLRIALAAIGENHMADNQIHYSYEFVKLPGAKMSGRLGRYVTLNEVLDKAVELAYEEVARRNPELSEEEKKEIAEMVGHGAVKYALLSVDPMKQVVFDWGKALNFEDNSAPYIQYSHARTCNILKRAQDSPEPDYSTLVDPKERALVATLARFPKVFLRAQNELQPVNITAYANQLADRFNSFYATQPVLNAPSPGLRGARLKLVDATRVTLRNALTLLGIDAPQRM